MQRPRSIDCWVNVTMGDIKPPDYLVRVKEDYLHGGSDFFRSFTPEEMLEIMDEHGVEKAIISTGGDDSNPRPFDFVDRFPERFALSVSVNPLGFMNEIRRLESMTRNYPCALARVVPFGIQVAPSDASYYPLYSKCIELDLALSINTGLPGPPVPGACQDPMHLDLVCFRFPELKLCMAHGAGTVVGCGDPLDDQVQEPAPDDVGVLTKATAARTVAFHEHARPGQDHLGVRPRRADDATHHHRSLGTRSARGRARQVPLRERGTVFFSRLK